MKILKSIAMTLVLCLVHFIVRGSFYNTLADDVEFNYGKHHMRNRRRKMKKGLKTFWVKFFFLDVKKEVKKWHYVCFWINCISFIPIVILLNCVAIFEIPAARKSLNIFIAVYFITWVFTSFAYWDLSPHGNVIERRKKYRKTNRK